MLNSHFQIQQYQEDLRIEVKLTAGNYTPQTETCTKSYLRLGPATSYTSDGIESSPNSDWNLSLQARTQTYSL